MPIQPIPKGLHSITPLLIIRNAKEAIEFYKRAFGATEAARLTGPSGEIVHAELKIGDSSVMIAEENPDWGNFSPTALKGSPLVLHLYHQDVDALAERAVAAGAKVVIPVADQFYGDRAGRLLDPFGHLWAVATHKEDVSPEEMQRRLEGFFKEDDGR